MQGVEQQSLMEFLQGIQGGMSERDMAAWFDLAQGTVNRLLNEVVTPHETTLQKIAKATGVPLPALREMAKRPPGTPHPFRLPAEANQLTESQRKVVRRMVSELLASSNPAKVTR